MDYKAYFEELLARLLYADGIEVYLQSNVDNLYSEISKCEEAIRIAENDYEDSHGEIRFKIEIDDLNDELKNLKKSLLIEEDLKRYWQNNKNQLID